MEKALPVSRLRSAKGRVPVWRTAIEVALLEKEWPWEAGWPLTPYC